MLQQDYANHLHNKGHLGIESTKCRVKDILYWPSMSKDIENLVKECDICNSMKPHQQREPLKSYPIPNRPWSIVASDLFEWNGLTYLILVYSYSGWFELNSLHNTASKTVIRKLKGHFARFGVPDTLISDNGPQYSSQEFKDFAAKWEFNHTMSSPHFPSSNGLAERAVQSAKQLLEKTKRDGSDIFMNILNHRNTPRDSTLGSSAQRLLSRRTRTIIPMTEASLRSEIPDPQKIQHKLSEKRQQRKKYYDKSAKPLSFLRQGDRVRMQTAKGFDRPGVIKETCKQPRSYWLRTDDGGTYRRNRRHILKVPDSSEKTSVNKTESTATKPTNVMPMVTQSGLVVPSKPTVVPVPTSATPVVTRSGRMVVPPSRYSP